jgi:DNA-binding NarL/FixJ family response regulator
MEKIKVVIADDHPLIRQGIKQIIELESDINVIGQAANGEEAVKMILELNPDVCLVDINMPILNGIQAIQKLKELNCKCKPIVLTIHNDRDYLIKAIQLGAYGYVLKDAEAQVLIDAIRKVYKGESYIPSSLAAELIKGYGNSAKDENEEQLTERETEVLKLIADGKSNKEIGGELFISEKTVKNHISNIFRKLNINDRTQAAIYAIKNGLKK